jgi:hypothetical protein
MTYDIRKITYIFHTTNVTGAGFLYDTGLKRFCMYVSRLFRLLLIFDLGLITFTLMLHTALT